MKKRFFEAFAYMLMVLLVIISGLTFPIWILVYIISGFNVAYFIILDITDYIEGLGE